MILGRAAVAEGIGTMLLLTIVVGSGIMGERLSQGNAAIALLANSIATGAGLFVLIELFGPISGAHLNPIVSVVSAWRRTIRGRDCIVYIVAQVIGAFSGVLVAHAMFNLSLIQSSSHYRQTFGESFGEVIATFGLVLIIVLLSTIRPRAISLAMAAYITSAYWFTSSTSFANPAVTLARAATDTFAGIAPYSVPQFIGAEILGAAAATLCGNWLVCRVK